MSTPLFLTLVIGYIFKDRMKEAIRYVLSARLKKILSDRQQFVYQNFSTLSGLTDDQGRAAFELPVQPYKIRVDYLGGQYFTDPFIADEPRLTIPEGRARINLTWSTGVLPGVPVYLFSPSDTYLGLSGTTDEAGSVLFQVPEGCYKFRANYQASRFWATGEVLADTTRNIDLNTGGGRLAVTLRSSSATVLEGVTCYLFSGSDAYLGKSTVTDDSGIALFDVADGSYKLRADYLGYSYWSDTVEAPDSLSADILIHHNEIAVAVAGDQASGQFALPGVNCYVFTGPGTYTGLTAATNEEGRARFTLPDQPYKIRADYLNTQYWSGDLDGEDTGITIPHGTIKLSVTDKGYPAPGLTTYIFNTTGSYLGISATTNEAGIATFSLPQGSYQIRVDADGAKYWTRELNILSFQDNEFDLELTDESLCIGILPLRPV